MTLERLDECPPDEAEAQLQPCCGSRAWARRLAESRPFGSLDELLAASDRIWWSLGREDWLEAFAAHPRIGEKVSEEGRSARWSSEEQAGASEAAADLLAELADANRRYEERFGHTFIVCASGKGAAEMLARLLERLGNDPETELRVAAEEQQKITNLRLEKLLS